MGCGDSLVGDWAGVYLDHFLSLGHPKYVKDKHAEHFHEHINTLCIVTLFTVRWRADSLSCGPWETEDTLTLGRVTKESLFSNHHLSNRQGKCHFITSSIDLKRYLQS